MVNELGCDGCEYLTKDNQCNWGKKHNNQRDNEDLLRVGDCGKYEFKKSIEKRIIDIIKVKIETATPKELQESLVIIKNKLRALKVQKR